MDAAEASSKKRCNTKVKIRLLHSRLMKAKTLNALGSLDHSQVKLGISAMYATRQRLARAIARAIFCACELNGKIPLRV